MCVRYIGKTLAFEWIDDSRMLVSVSGDREFSTGDWKRYLGAIYAHENDNAGMRALVVAGKGKPDRTQQQDIMSLPNQDSRRVAIISESLALRFLVSVFVLVVPQVKLFPSRQIDDALLFLGLESREAEVARRSLDRLREDYARAAVA